MNSNYQGRRAGKSVSFRGQSNENNFNSRSRNDSNSYDNRPRNTYRDQKNFEGSNQSYQDESEARKVTLLPDANMTISVQNDFRGSGRGRSKNSRGILKSNSFRDDTYISNRPSEFTNRSDVDNQYSDYDNSNYSKRGFETYSYQNNRNRKSRGFYNRSKVQEIEHVFDKDYTQSNDMSRGRSKSAGDRQRRGRGGRGRGRGRQNNRFNEQQFDGPTSGDGDKEESKEQDDETKNYVEETEQNSEIQISEIQKTSEVPEDNESDKKVETPVENETKKDECDLKSETKETTTVDEEGIKPDEVKIDEITSEEGNKESVEEVVSSTE